MISEARKKASRKYEDSKTKVTLRMDSDFRAKLNEYAKKQNKSVNQLIHELIEKELKKHL